MKEIKQQIADRNFYKVYLLSGDEDYLVARAGNLLKQALVREGDEMNCQVLESSRIDFQQLAENARTFPFFSDKRVIILDRTGVLKSGKDTFLDILKEIPDTTCIIILENEVDKRSKIYKWIKKNQYAREFLKKDQSEKVLLKWIAALFGKENKRIRESDARYFLERIGNDMYQISNEASKLIAYTGDAPEIKRADIDSIVSGEIQNKIWDLISFIAGRDKERALNCYGDLVLLREPPMHILYLLVRQYRILLIMADMKSRGRGNDQIAKEAGIPSFSIRRYESQLGQYTLRDLEFCEARCLQVEEDIKTGRLTDQIGLELLIVSLSDRTL